MNIFGHVVQPRVGQLDASLLDSELLEQLRTKLWSAFSSFHPEIKDKYEQELSLLLRLVMYKLTVWDHSTTYGAKLQGLQLVRARSGKAMTTSQKLTYGAITILGSYLWVKLDDYIAAASYDSSDDPHVQRMREWADKARFGWTAASLVNFVLFLYSGRYSTLILRLLRIRFAPVSRSAFRHVNYEFQNRQLVWNAMTEFLLFALPLLNLARIQRRVARFIGWSGGSGNAGKLGSLPERVCPVCFEQDTADAGVTNPYVTDCGHLYCYVCIQLKLADDPDGWPCLRCGTPVKAAKPMN